MSSHRKKPSLKARPQALARLPSARVVTLAMYDYHITEQNGKHSLIGIFDTLWCQQFPMRVGFYLFIKTTGSPGQHKARVELWDKSSNQLVLQLPNFDFDLPPQPVAYQELITQMSLEIPHPGILEWRVYVDNQLDGLYPFQVVNVPGEEKADAG